MIIFLTLVLSRRMHGDDDDDGCDDDDDREIVVAPKNRVYRYYTPSPIHPYRILYYIYIKANAFVCRIYKHVHNRNDTTRYYDADLVRVTPYSIVRTETAQQSSTSNNGNDKIVLIITTIKYKG